MSVYTDEQKRKLEAMVAKWQKTLKLEHWRIQVDWDKKPARECGLEVGLLNEMQTAEIVVGEFFDSDEVTQEYMVCHELVHCVLAGVDAVATSLVEHLGSEAKALAEQWLESEIEKATDHLAKLLTNQRKPSGVSSNTMVSNTTMIREPRIPAMRKYY